MWDNKGIAAADVEFAKLLMEQKWGDLRVIGVSSRTENYGFFTCNYMVRLQVGDRSSFGNVHAWDIGISYPLVGSDDNPRATASYVRRHQEPAACKQCSKELDYFIGHPLTNVPHNGYGFGGFRGYDDKEAEFALNGESIPTPHELTEELEKSVHGDEMSEYEALFLSGALGLALDDILLNPNRPWWMPNMDRGTEIEQWYAAESRELFSIKAKPPVAPAKKQRKPKKHLPRQQNAAHPVHPAHNPFRG